MAKINRLETVGKTPESAALIEQGRAEIRPAVRAILTTFAEKTGNRDAACSLVIASLVVTLSDLLNTMAANHGMTLTADDCRPLEQQIADLVNAKIVLLDARARGTTN